MSDLPNCTLALVAYPNTADTVSHPQDNYANSQEQQYIKYVYSKKKPKFFT